MIRKSILIPVISVLISSGVVAFASENMSSSNDKQVVTGTSVPTEPEIESEKTSEEKNKSNEQEETEASYNEDGYRYFTSNKGNTITTSDKIGDKNKSSSNSSDSSSDTSTPEEINPLTVLSVSQFVNNPSNPNSLITCKYTLQRGDGATVIQSNTEPCLKVGDILSYHLAG